MQGHDGVARIWGWATMGVWGGPQWGFGVGHNGPWGCMGHILGEPRDYSEFETCFSLDRTELEARVGLPSSSPTSQHKTSGSWPVSPGRGGGGGGHYPYLMLSCRVPWSSDTVNTSCSRSTTAHSTRNWWREALREKAGRYAYTPSLRRSLNTSSRRRFLR